jgi:hypothetical protein
VKLFVLSLTDSVTPLYDQVFLGLTRGEVEEVLYELVKGWWPHTIGQNTVIPHNHSEAVELYFHKYNEQKQTNFTYRIDEAEISFNFQDSSVSPRTIELLGRVHKVKLALLVLVPELLNS